MIDLALAKRLQELGAWAARAPAEGDVIRALTTGRGHVQGERLRWMGHHPESPIAPPGWCYEPEALEPIISEVMRPHAILQTACVFIPTLSDLLDALAAKGYTDIQLNTSGPDEGHPNRPVMRHCIAWLEEKCWVGGSRLPYYWEGSVEGKHEMNTEAAAVCLLEVLEAERTVRPCTACGDECPIEEVEP